MPSASAHRHDVIVIGGGHAGVEAALAAGRLGADVLLLTMSCDTVGVMSCNPAIGGVGKGQIVREIDALGGLMGRAIDATGIQFRMLNRSKGPAMHSPRAQADKQDYRRFVKLAVEDAAGVSVRQETVIGLEVRSQKSEVRSDTQAEVAAGNDACELLTPDFKLLTCTGVRVADGTVFRAPAVVLTTGTFMAAVMHTGEAQSKGGRAGEGTTAGLSGALRELGFELNRFKTGTPCRVHGGTIDWAACEPQPGDADPQPFSFLTERIAQSQVDCYLTGTTSAVHDLIRANLHRAPMYSGAIHGTGPRYCPSIEDKVVRFADKSVAPGVPGTGGPRHPRGVLQRHLHQPAAGRAGRTRPRHPRVGAGPDHPARLRRRVRLRPADAAQEHARNAPRGRAVFRRAD